MNEPLQRKALLPVQKPSTLKDELPPEEINRIGREKGFDLSGVHRDVAPKRKSRPPRETRSDQINVRIKPSLGEALRQYTYTEEVSMADVIEKMIQRYIIDKSEF